MRVLQSFPAGGSATNPYLLQLVRALEALPGRPVEVAHLSWRAALVDPVDVLHVHWPERLVRGGGALGTLGRRIRFLLLLLRIRRRRIAVVRTVHNLESHESGGRVERALLAALDRRTTLRIRLNPLTPVPPGSPVRTVLHGHYRDWFTAPTPPRAPGRVLFFGLVRRYKGVEDLLAAFAALPDPALSLRIVGSVQGAGLRDELAERLGADHRVSARFAYVDDAELQREVGEATLVVLPYRAVHNSGAALLALSLGRPVLLPDADTTRALQAEVGERWVRLFTGALTAEALDAAIRATGTVADEPTMSPGRDWPAVAAQHLAAYEAALGVVRGGTRGQSRRYSA